MKKILKSVLTALLTALLSVGALADDVYIISGVPISGESDSAAKAREQALSHGKKAAFKELLDTVVAVQDREKITVDDEKLIESFVQDISVSNERAGSTKYYGALTVRFKAPEIRRLLEAAQVGFLARLPQPFIVIPVYQTEQGVFLFSENNPLWKAVQNDLPATRLFTFQPVRGDSDDEMLAQSGVINQNPHSLSELAQKYYVSQILILKVMKQNTSYTVQTTLWPNGSAPEAEVSFKVSDDRESAQRICADLVKDTIRAMTKKWLYLTQNTAQPLTVYQVFVPIEKVSDLSRIKQKLARLNFADKVDIKGFSNKQLTVDFHYRGSAEELGEKLRLNQLILTVHADSAGQPVYLLTEAVFQAEAPNEAEQKPIEDL